MKYWKLSVFSPFERKQHFFYICLMNNLYEHVIIFFIKFKCKNVKVNILQFDTLLATFGCLFLGHGTRKRKSVDRQEKVISSINSKKKKPHQNWMKYKNLYALQLFDISDFRNKVATFVLSTNNPSRWYLKHVIHMHAQNSYVTFLVSRYTHQSQFGIRGIMGHYRIEFGFQENGICGSVLLKKWLCIIYLLDLSQNTLINMNRHFCL
jgi:hypothetical protein